jgi:hypothetical protein
MSKESQGINSCLSGKKVILSLVEQPTGSLFKDEGDSTLLIGASISLTLPTNQHNVLIDPLTEEERLYLESILKRDLSVYTDEGIKFWKSKQAMVKITRFTKSLKDSNIILDLSNPHEFIKYKICLASNRVANSWEERYDNKEYIVVLKDGEQEFAESIKKIEKEDEVLQYLYKIKTNKRKMYNLIRLHGEENTSTPITFGSSVELMYTTLREIAGNTRGVNSLHKLVTLEDKDLNMKILVADAVTVGLLEKRGWEYRLQGGEKIGSTSDDVIAYLLDKGNQNVRIRIEQEVEDFYKKAK